VAKDRPDVGEDSMHTMSAGNPTETTFLSALSRVAVAAASLIMAMSCGSRADQAMRTVERWDMVELSLTNPKGYTNPFKDVVLECRMASPSGREAKVYGFYDGGSTWRLRLMPDEPGVWNYRASFSDGARGIEGKMKCVKGKLHGPLRVSRKNPLWFERADGTPVYLCAFHLWDVDGLDRNTLAKTLDFIKSQGFNAVVGPHLTPRRGLPWERGAGAKTDFSRFNLDVWRGLDQALRALAARDMVLIPFNIFGGTNGMPKIPTRDEEDLFIRYWVARWGGFWNATYQPVSEWEEGFSEAEVTRICTRLREEDGGRHVVSVHSLEANPETVQRAPWLDYHTVQDKLMDLNPIKYAELADLSRKSKKPILAHECLWEGNLYQKEPGLDMDNMRRGAWIIALSGGQINYADEVIFPRKYQLRGRDEVYYSVVGSAMKPCGLLYGSLKILSGFMRSLPLGRMVPCPELSSGKVCLAEPGKQYVAYSPDGAAITLDLSRAEGRLKTYWLDPRTGRRSAGTSLTGGESRSFATPGEGDWVLHVAVQRRGM